MNTRYIVFLMAMMAGMLTATSQEVVKVHMKDGSVHTYYTGDKNYIYMSFWSYQPDNTHFSVDVGHDNNYQSVWDVNGVVHANKQYNAVVYWTSDASYCLNPVHGLCFGEKPNLSVENSDAVVTYDYNNQTSAIYDGGKRYLWSREHYMVIGSKLLSLQVPIAAPDLDPKTVSWASDYLKPTELVFVRRDTVRNMVKCALEYGKTYYYRPYFKGIVDGSDKYFYGPEHSFRVPYVMADSEYYPTLQGSSDAIADFQQYFPQGYTVPSWNQMDSLWNVWRETAEGKAVDLSSDISSIVFDDGTGYRLNKIPQQFYQWLKGRQIAIDPLKGLAEVSTVKVQGEIIPAADATMVRGIDAKWGVPGNSYMLFTPVSATVNPIVTFRSAEVVPGTHYKVEIVFAPETKEQTAENADDFLPTKVVLTTIEQINGKDKSTIIPDAKEVSGTEVTTLTIDDLCINSMEMKLQIQTYVTSSQISNHTYNRILRIAGIRLTPLANQ